jgi:hypothetical protein
MDITVTATFVRESPSGEAILVKQGALHVWIPRSQISYLQKQSNNEIVMSLPEWLANKKGLDYV